MISQSFRMFFTFIFAGAFFKKTIQKLKFLFFLTIKLFFFFNNEKIANYEKTSVHILKKKENKLILN